MRAKARKLSRREKMTVLLNKKMSSNLNNSIEFDPIYTTVSVQRKSIVNSEIAYPSHLNDKFFENFKK